MVARACSPLLSCVGSSGRLPQGLTGVVVSAPLPFPHSPHLSSCRHQERQSTRCFGWSRRWCPAGTCLSPGSRCCCCTSRCGRSASHPWHSAPGRCLSHSTCPPCAAGPLTPTTAPGCSGGHRPGDPPPTHTAKPAAGTQEWSLHGPVHLCFCRRGVERGLPAFLSSHGDAWTCIAFPEFRNLPWRLGTLFGRAEGTGFESGLEISAK